MTYFRVYRTADKQGVGSIQARDALEAVFRLVGGPYGRIDFYAEPTDRPTN